MQQSRRDFLKTLATIAAQASLPGAVATANLLEENPIIIRLREIDSQLDTYYYVNRHIETLCGLNERLLTKDDRSMTPSMSAAVDIVNNLPERFANPNALDKLSAYTQNTRQHRIDLYKEAIGLLRKLRSGGIETMDHGLSGLIKSNIDDDIELLTHTLGTLQKDTMWKDFIVMAHKPSGAAIRTFTDKHYAWKHEVNMHQFRNDIAAPLRVELNSWDQDAAEQQAEAERYELEVQKDRNYARETVERHSGKIDVAFAEGNGDSNIESAILITSKDGKPLDHLVESLVHLPKRVDIGMNNDHTKMTIFNPSTELCTLFRQGHMERLETGKQAATTEPARK